MASSVRGAAFSVGGCPARGHRVDRDAALPSSAALRLLQHVHRGLRHRVDRRLRHGPGRVDRRVLITRPPAPRRRAAAWLRRSGRRCSPRPAGRRSPVGVGQRGGPGRARVVDQDVEARSARSARSARRPGRRQRRGPVRLLQPGLDRDRGRARFLVAATASWRCPGRSGRSNATMAQPSWARRSAMARPMPRDPRSPGRSSRPAVPSSLLPRLVAVTPDPAGSGSPPTRHAGPRPGRVATTRHAGPRPGPASTTLPSIFRSKLFK